MNEDEQQIKVKRGPKKGDANSSYSGARELLGEEFARQIIDQTYRDIAAPPAPVT